MDNETEGIKKDDREWLKKAIDEVFNGITLHIALPRFNNLA
jgi:hypothetical protein